MGGTHVIQLIRTLIPDPMLLLLDDPVPRPCLRNGYQPLIDCSRQHLRPHSVPLLGDRRRVVVVVHAREVGEELGVGLEGEGDVDCDEGVGFGAEDLEELRGTEEGVQGLVEEVFEGLHKDSLV
jgi:hypothetical protein